MRQRRALYSVSMVALLVVPVPEPVFAAPLRTVTVSPVPGGPAASGAALLGAIAGITGASGTNPWLVKVEPGLYFVQSATVTMIPFVNIEGSGRNVTTIVGGSPGGAVIEGASDSSLSLLTTFHLGSPSNGFAVRNAGDRFRMEQVTAGARKGATAFSNRGHDTRVDDLDAFSVDATSGATAVTNSGQRAFWTRVRASASGSGIIYAFFNFTDSEFSEIVAEAESADAFAGAIRNEGGSPIMRNVRAHAKGATGQAITNGASSSTKLYDVYASAEGDEATGISNQFGKPVLKNVDIRAEGVTAASGIHSLFGAVVTMSEVTAVATASGSGAGLLTDASVSKAQNSSFTGDGFSVDNRFDASAASYLGASQLVGPVRAGPGVLKCVASYDGAFDPLSAACLP